MKAAPTITKKGRRRMALAAIRQAAQAEVFVAVVKECAAEYGCPSRAIIGENRGEPRVARARAVAMHVLVGLGVPIQTTAEGLRRTRRAVHEAMRIGRPGYEGRDQDVLAHSRAVRERVLGRDLPALSRFKRGGKTGT